MESKRAVLVEPRRFEFEVADVSPSPTQVLVKIAACGLCNWELNHWKGIITPYPMRLGHEWAGTIIETGREVKKFKPGDRVSVLSLQGFAEYSVAEENMTFALADDVKLEDGIGEPLKCIITVVRATAPEAGDHGVVLGCGPMGLWCLQAMSGHLTASLTAVDVDENKLKLARKFGATHTINPKNEDILARITEITGGHLADFVIEGTGRPEMLEKASLMIKYKQGRMILMSSHEEASRNFDFRDMVHRGAKLLVAHPAYSLDQPDDMRRAIENLNLGIFDMSEMITHRFRLDDIQKAFETLEHKPSDYIKGIVIP